jgi:hypothetical protein
MWAAVCLPDDRFALHDQTGVAAALDCADISANVESWK